MAPAWFAYLVGIVALVATVGRVFRYRQTKNTYYLVEIVPRIFVAFIFLHVVHIEGVQIPTLQWVSRFGYFLMFVTELVPVIICVWAQRTGRVDKEHGCRD
jgi:hypothetical protein